MSRRSLLFLFLFLSSIFKPAGGFLDRDDQDISRLTRQNVFGIAFSSYDVLV